MNIDLHLRNQPLSPDDAEHLNRRLLFALSRFGHRIAVIRVQLEDLNGPKGGRDKCCRIRLVGDGFEPFVVEAADANLLAAIDRAADRAGRAMARAVERSRRTHRPEVRAARKRSGGLGPALSAR